MLRLAAVGPVVVATLGMWSAGSARGSVVQADADTYLRDATPRGGLAFMDVRGGAIDFGGYLRFDLSGLNIDQVSDATLTLNVVPGASRNDTPTTGRFALQGLDNVAGNTPQNWDEATLSEGGTNSVGAEWVSSGTSLQNVTDLDGDVVGITESLTGAASGTGTFTVSGAALVSFLNARADDGGLVTFIITNEDTNDRGYGLASRENATTTLQPMLDITFATVPEPTGAALFGLVGIGTLLRRRRQAR
jgi:hypothetical protein